MLAWYSRNVTGFIKDFGLMTAMIDELQLQPQARELFLLKLNMVYQTDLEIAREKAEEEAKKC